jgi:hypothetical protein
MVSDSVVQNENRIFELAEKFILLTSRSLFLTGKAGTGKTTFLKRIKSVTTKNTVVVAPTGVAAVNAGGTTIHSFFQLPFTPFIPVRTKGVLNEKLSDRYTLLQNLRIETEKRNIFRELELLIIDEVSMVRCDVLDSIDVILRHFRRKEHLPFGGVQVLFIGDLFQLPPVVQSQEWSILGEFYKSPFFFDSYVVREAPPLYIELKHIFRQKDPVFIDILNKVRNNQVNVNDLDFLNERFDLDFSPGQEEKYITLTTHNAKADKINMEELDLLPGEIVNYSGTVEGEFPERSFPTEKILTLKSGAQIMFLKNDMEKVRRYYNGKIGNISRIDDGRIYVTFSGEDGELEVEKDTWRNVKYSFNATTKNIEEEVIGTFTQYGIRLAWAITIHKSQGLTFENAIIDAGNSFAPGQVYVALSRCTSLNGLILKSKIFRSAIMADERVLEFSEAELNEEKLEPLLKVEQQQYLLEGIIRIFDWSIVQEEFDGFRKKLEDSKIKSIDKILDEFDRLYGTLDYQQSIGVKFAAQLKNLVLQNDFENMTKRIEQGVMYFSQVAENELILPLSDLYVQLKAKKKVKKHLKKLEQLISLVKSLQDVFRKAPSIAEKMLHKRRDDL